MIVLSLLGLLLWPASSQADVTFDDATAGKMVVALEQAKITEQQLTIAAKENTELQAQADILKGTVKLLEDQAAIYKSMADMNQKMSDMKDKACVEQVKAAKPTFTQNLGKYFTGMVGGAGLLGLALILL